MGRTGRWRGLILAAFAALMALSGCGQTRARGSDLVMGTWVTVDVEGAPEMVEGVLSLLKSCEARWDPALPQSDIARVNAGAGGPVEVSSQTAAFLRQALELSRDTGGAFDVTVAPVLRVWGLEPGNWQQERPMPAQKDIAAALALVGWQGVNLEGNTVTLPTGAALDMAAIAKGMAADLACGWLRERGVRSALIDMGGSVTLLGDHDGRDWVIGVADPLGGDPVASLTLSDTSIATAGAGERCVIIDGQPYGHIVDPRTGRPAQTGLLSVAVACQNAAVADALSTAVFVLGPEEGLSLLEGWPGAEGLLLLSDRTVMATPGLREKVSLRREDWRWH